MLHRPFAYEYLVNAGIFAPGTVGALVFVSPGDLSAYVPTLVVIAKLLVIQVVIPGAFAVARLMKRNKKDALIARQREAMSDMADLLEVVKTDLTPAAQLAVDRVLRHVNRSDE